MKPKLLLRIAAAMMFLHLVGHTFGAATWKDASDPAKQEVIRQMTGQKFPFMGTARSMGDYYDGYGYSTTLMFLLVVALLWMLSGIADRNSGLSAKVLLPIVLFLLFLGIDELIFFFPLAAGFSLLGALFGGFAFFKLKRMEVPR